MKCCLTCAFCIRNQNTYHSVFVKPELSKWCYKKESLSALHRVALSEANDQFIGQEIRDQKLWDERLELEKERRKKEALQHYIAAFPKFLLNPERQASEDAEEYGFSPRPLAPDQDYLSCFHEQWDESKRDQCHKERKYFLENKTCSFYYPFKNHEQTLDACEKNRKDLQDKNRFWFTNILVIIGIAITVIGVILTAPRG